MNKKNKHLFGALLFFAVCTLCCCCIVSADSRSDVIISLQIDNPVMTVNGENREIDESGTSPVIVNERTLVPVRAIIEAFGGTVSWDSAVRTVLLDINDDTVRLVIGSNTAYLNGKEEKLDVAPAVINDRTMLPIRFVAEGFNFGVAWEGQSRTIYIVRECFTDDEYEYLMGEVGEYIGAPYRQINGNKPLFKDYEIIPASFEYYSSLDGLGRCDVCYSSIAMELMPTEVRGSISSVKPTGWKNKAYDFVDGRYLYNRCHLIGFQLTGENANKRNLITGTRYLNVDGMLPFENEVADYIKKTGNRVIYRVTPVFTGDNLVADGVLIEAYSVEDEGRGVAFCVYCYNVQPGVTIDYKTGENNAS